MAANIDDILKNATLDTKQTFKFSKETTKKPWEVTSGWETIASPQAKELISAFKKIAHLLDMCFKNRDTQEDSLLICTFSIELDLGRLSVSSGSKLSFNYALLKKSHEINYIDSAFYDEYKRIKEILLRITLDHKYPTKDEMLFLNEVYKKETKK